MPVDKVKRYDEAYNKIYRDCETKRLKAYNEIRRDYESRRQKAYNKYKETERKLLDERDRKVKKLLADMVHYSKYSKGS